MYIYKYIVSMCIVMSNLLIMMYVTTMVRMIMGAVTHMIAF